MCRWNETLSWKATAALQNSIQGNQRKEGKCVVLGEPQRICCWLNTKQPKHIGLELMLTGCTMHQMVKSEACLLEELSPGGGRTNMGFVQCDTLISMKI